MWPPFLFLKTIYIRIARRPPTSDGDESQKYAVKTYIVLCLFEKRIIFISCYTTYKYYDYLRI